MAAALRRLQSVSSSSSRLLFLRSSAPTPRLASASFRRLPSSSHLRPFHHAPLSLQYQAEAESAEPDQVAESHDGTAAEISTFEDLSRAGLVDERILSGIRRMGYTDMTPVQQKTIATALDGVDILAHAKTGTGKTLAFLIPLMQNMLARIGDGTRMPRHRSGDPVDFHALIISPTRELAEQIAAEARKIANPSVTGISVKTAVGGNGRNYALQDMKHTGCHILVGTPGRLNDILSDPGSNIQAPNLSTLVLDEADRLLDQGFLPQITQIASTLPDPRQVHRQTMLFSATVPRSIMSIVRETMDPNFEFVQTVDPNEAPTHERVPQKIVNVGGFENYLPCLLELVKREKANASPSSPFKALVYLPTTSQVHVATETFHNLRSAVQSQATGSGYPPSLGGRYRPKSLLYPTEVFGIHSKLSQPDRTRVTAAFKHASSAILFSSDVTARGMDFPNVTHVIQLGLPNTRDDYIHRIGRTARAGKEGAGWLFVADMEVREAEHRLGGLPLKYDNSLGCAGVDMSARAELPAETSETLMQVGEAAKAVDYESKSACYRALLSGAQKHVKKDAYVENMNRLSRYGWGMEEPPTISPTIAMKLGLRDVPGLRLAVGRPMDNSFGGASTGSFGGYPGRGGYGQRSENDFGSRSGSFGGRGSGSFGGRGSGSFGGRGTERSGSGRSFDEGFGGGRRTSGFGR